METRAHRLTGMVVVAALSAGCGLSSGCGVFADREQAMAEDSIPAEATPQRTVYADRNRDGRVTKAEAKVDDALVAVFDQYDGNRDGDLDRAEFARLEEDSQASAAPDLRPFARPRNDPTRLYQ